MHANALAFSKPDERFVASTQPAPVEGVPNGIGKVGLEPVGRKLQKTAFFELNPVLLGFRDALPGAVDLERAQADARKGSNPGELPDEIKNAAPHPAA